MRRMTLQEIQQVNLEMMKDIHAFCVKKDIHYSLAYGSLIGAIRHKGFIPWDDDIDIWMPRPDFERFSQEYKSTRGFKLSSVYDDDTFVNYTRVYDNQTLVVSPGIAAKFDVGVWIDIYPIDGISNDDDISKDQFFRIRKYTRLVSIYRTSRYQFNKGSYKNKLKAVIYLIYLKAFVKGNFANWHHKISTICKEFSFEDSQMCSSLVCVEANKKNKQEIFKTSDFKEFTLTPFEDQRFYITSGYDAVLKSIFGDYMIVPPKEKQFSHSATCWDYYWK